MLRLSVVVPTLNEERYLANLLSSLKNQDFPPHEVIIVDGGSTDRTLEIARSYGVEILVSPGIREYSARNLGAQTAIGELLLFTSADCEFRRNTIRELIRRFEEDENLLAIAGAGILIDPPLLFRIEFPLYNLVRYLSALLPKPFKRFSTSTNLLALRRETFFEVGAFESDNPNEDGKLGAKVCRAGKIYFSLRSIVVRQSSRRLRNHGFIGANMYFFYVVENFFPFLSQSRLIRRMKDKVVLPRATKMRIDGE